MVMGVPNWPLFGDFLFFIPTRMYFCSRTYFATIKDLTIICMNKFLKSNMQVSSSLHQATMVPRNATYVVKWTSYN